MDLKRLATSAKMSASAKRRIDRQGLTPNGARLWTPDEEEILRQAYPDYDAMCSRLPHRTRVAVQIRCRMLGMKTPNHLYSAAEISKLRKLYPRATKEEICAALPDIPWRKITSTVKRYKIRRVRKPYKITGKKHMDQIHQRIYEIGWFRSDLDEQSGTRKYFRNRNWLRHKPNYQKLERAVRALDGEFEIKWKEYDD